MTVNIIVFNILVFVLLLLLLLFNLTEDTSTLDDKSLYLTHTFIIVHMFSIYDKSLYLTHTFIIVHMFSIFLVRSSVTFSTVTLVCYPAILLSTRSQNSQMMRKTGNIG